MQRDHRGSEIHPQQAIANRHTKTRRTARPDEALQKSPNVLAADPSQPALARQSRTDGYAPLAPRQPGASTATSD
jgi:hypothetical protein